MKRWLGFIAALLVTIGCAVGAVVMRRGHAFPFTELEMVADAKSFNRPPDVPFLIDPPDVQALAREVRRLMRHGHAPGLDAPPPRNAPPSSVTGVCSEYAKTAQAFAAQDGHALRTLWLSTHTVNEYWHPTEGRWIALDISANQQWLDPDGRALAVAALMDPAQPATPTMILSREELAADPALADGLNFDEQARRHYTDSAICVVVEDDRLFDFHRRNRSPLAVAGHLLAGKPVARGRQYARSPTPPPAGSIMNGLRLLALTTATAWLAAVGWWWRQRPARGGA